MRLSTILSRYALVMLVFTGTALGLAWWSIERDAFMRNRIHWAHSSLEEHMGLRANVADLFKQYADVLLVGERDGGEHRDSLKAAIQDNLANIRRAVAEEIELVGQEETEELDELALLELTLRRQIADIERQIALPAEAQRRDELARILDEGIDRDLASQIDRTIGQEADEVEETEAAARAQTVFLRRLLAGLLVAVMLGTVLLLLVWQAVMARPLARLRDGVRELSEGNYGHRMALRGRSEIAEVAGVLDQLAERVEARERSLSDQNAALEAAVAARTADLAQLLGEAREQEEARRQMLADVSHELRTPLTIIIGESDIALRGADKPPEVYREALARTREAAARTTLLVEDLLFMARNESGRPRLNLDRFELRPTVEQAVAMIDPGAPAVLCDLAQSPIQADRNRIRQAVAALVQNARLYGGPDIVVRLLATPQGYHIQVEDDGPGLTPEECRRAFTRFFRGSNAVERDTEGSGLGLPIVRAIAEAHGGGAWLEPRPGGGTIAVLELPRAPHCRKEVA
ncbi:HAMP domain-containing sensor histidine kinase [Paracoccus sp. (in: a-proteobacteria)]|uniref:sensor histidine kinase n=1 Tax=Paracoccus sp. TaxID=267 RepID=UPI003220307B